jgi:hypothetical protein
MWNITVFSRGAKIWMPGGHGDKISYDGTQYLWILGIDLDATLLLLRILRWFLTF